MLRFIISLALIVLAGLLQSATWFVLMGVKPDLVMVMVLVMLVSDGDWIDRLAFILVGELMLQFGPTPDIYSIIFIVLMVMSAMVFDYISLQQYVILGVVTFLATVLMDIYGHIQWGFILTEVAYNLVLVMLVYAVLNAPYGKKIHQ